MGTNDSTPEATTDDRADTSADDQPPAPGDAAGVPVPHEQPAGGTSEEFSKVQGVRPHPVDPDPEDTNRGGKSF
jgi:hypothetical protein